MNEFRIEMIAKKELTVKANSLEEAEKLAKEKFLQEINECDVDMISSVDETAYAEFLSKCREEVISCIDENIEGLAESHVDSWKERYFGKDREDISYDLTVNHDISLELESIEDELGYSLNDYENQYLCDAFEEAVLNEIFQ